MQQLILRASDDTSLKWAYQYLFRLRQDTWPADVLRSLPFLLGLLILTSFSPLLLECLPLQPMGILSPLSPSSACTSSLPSSLSSAPRSLQAFLEKSPHEPNKIPEARPPDNPSSSPPKFRSPLPTPSRFPDITQGSPGIREQSPVSLWKQKAGSVLLRAHSLLDCGAGGSLHSPSRMQPGPPSALSPPWT